MHVIGPELGLTQPGIDDRLRRQPHLDARRLRRRRVRHRHEPGARRARDPVPGAAAAEGAPHRGDREAPRRRLREGRDPRNHPPARRERRRRLRVRVRRPGDRGDDARRADHRLQHVDRGRRALRLRESRRDDDRLPRGTAVRAAGRGISSAPSQWLARDRERPRLRPYADRVEIAGRRLAPTVTWGINPGQSVGVDETLPTPGASPTSGRAPRWRRPTTSWV